MRIFVFGCRHVACLVGAVGLIAGCHFCTGGYLAGEVRQTSRALQVVAGGKDAETPLVHQCGAASQLSGAKPQPPQQLKLEARPGVPLQFKCGDSETLHPEAVGQKFPNVYRYAADGACGTASSFLLDNEVSGATLTKKGEPSTGGPTGTGRAGPETYEFLYNIEPAAEKLLCYTCNGAAASEIPPLTQLSDSDTEKCTIFIKVPQKTTTSTATASTAASTTHSTTAPPSSETSDARALSAVLATAAGVALGLMLLV